MVDIISPDTNQTIVLNPVGSDGNVFYIYSPYYYPNIYVEVRDHFSGKLLSHGRSNNFSTVEVRDGFGFRNTDNAKDAPLVVRTHQGL